MSLLLYRVLLILVLLCQLEGLKVDDSIHYVVNFETSNEDTGDGEKLVEENNKADEKTMKEDSDRVMRIKTRENENYVCHLPDTRQEEVKTSEVYTGPTPSELIAQLARKQFCSYRRETYWSYELCHGKFILQFHEQHFQNQKAQRTEYYLGNMHKDYITLSQNKDQMDPPRRIFQGQDLAYLPILYTHGTNCELTGKPRTTTVLYVCIENGNNDILSITETSSCEYEVIVMTPLLCTHPAFKPTVKKDFEIVCYSSSDKENPKPLSLLQQEAFHSDTFKREYTITHLTPQEDEFDEITIKAITAFQERQLADLAFKELLKEKEKDGHTLDVVQRVLAGHCIVTGLGWWKYEFCYGKKVVQFHQEPDGSRTEILLGVFDEKIHMAWVDDKKKERKSFMGRAQTSAQAKYIYTAGDMCQETRAHRSVEVRLRCHENTHKDSKHLEITIMEPSTCSYLLTLENGLFCEHLKDMDEYGLLRV